MRRRSRLQQTRQHALPTDYFRVRELTSAERAEFISEAEKMLYESQMIYDPSTEGYSGEGMRDWHWEGDKGGMSLFLNPRKDSPISDIRATGKITATIGEVMDLLIQETTEDYREVSQKFQPDFLDGVVLHTIVPRTPERPHRYIGIKWFAIKAPPGAIHPRDFCVLEYADTVTDMAGGACAFKVMKSIDLRDCPPLISTHKIVRGHIYYAAHRYNVTQTQGMLKATYSMRIDLSRRGSKSFRPFAYATSYSYMKKQALRIAEIEKLIDRERVNQLSLKEVGEWVPNNDKDYCYICRRNFSALRRPHHCRSCGDLVCGKCSNMYKAEVPTVGQTRLRLCCGCISDARPQKEQYCLSHAPRYTVEELSADTATLNQVTLLADQLSLKSEIQQAEGTMQHTYTYTGCFAPAAKKIILTGSFCGYRTDPEFGAVALRQIDDGKWVGILTLRPGEYTYKLYIDGHRWAHDDSDPTLETVKIESNNYCNVLKIGTIPQRFGQSKILGDYDETSRYSSPKSLI